MLPLQNSGAGLRMDDHPVILPEFPGKLVGAAIDRIDPRRAFGQQHVGEAAGRASYIHRYGVIHVPAEMIQGVRQLDPAARNPGMIATPRSEEHTSELQSLMRISYAVFCLKKKTITNNNRQHT